MEKWKFSIFIAVKNFVYPHIYVLSLIVTASSLEVPCGTQSWGPRTRPITRVVVQTGTRRLESAKELLVACGIICVVEIKIHDITPQTTRRLGTIIWGLLKKTMGKRRFVLSASAKTQDPRTDRST